MENKKDTMKKFKNGFMAYTETALGGCTALEPCDNHLTGNWTACFGCEGSQLKISKVKKAIVVQKEVVEKTKEESVERRSESRELAELEKWLEIMKRKENEVNQSC